MLTDIWGLKRQSMRRNLHGFRGHIQRWPLSLPISKSPRLADEN